ncbi:GNAT family N-acetyltransferase [Flexivirga alba]|uniref:GNAT family N-acetyltransferase n=1 Tax=Flexivirga alba TaxID=702742 RepID=A0ABW2AEF3_9MICO
MIRLIDPADDDAMRQVFDVGVAAKSVARPWFTPPSYKSWLIGMRQPDPEERQELYGFFRDGACVGTSLLFVPTQDNLEKVYADIDVAPEHRRRGVGAALVRHAKARVGELGRSALFVETFAPGEGADDHEYARFARSQGFLPAWREPTRHLELPVPAEKLADLAAASNARRDGYRIETYVGRVPDELLAGLAELMRMLAVDAPSGDVDFEPEEVTPDRLRRIYAREAEQGRIRLSSLAIDETSGAVAAQTDLVFDDTMDPVVQEGTYVHREHRGHRLGTAVKVANLQRLQRDYPGRPFIRTMNADTNEHMVSINVELGFEIVETSTEWIFASSTG